MDSDSVSLAFQTTAATACTWPDATMVVAGHSHKKLNQDDITDNLQHDEMKELYNKPKGYYVK